MDKSRIKVIMEQYDTIVHKEEEIDIEVAEDELKIDTYHASGAGGQHVNKTSSAVRIMRQALE